MQTFFSKEGKEKEKFSSEIEMLCRGLVYVSETDAPITYFSVPEASEASSKIILQQAAKRKNKQIEEVQFDDFFDRLISFKDWFGDREKVRAKKFLKLKQLLEENLTGIKVFRIGEIQVEIFVAGIDKEGRLAGVKTEAVET